MKNSGTTVLRTITTATTAILLAASATACSGSDDEAYDDEPPTLSDFETGDLDAPESVHPGEPFDVHVPGQDRETYYDLYTKSGDDWVLHQWLSISIQQNPPSAQAWEPGLDDVGVGLDGPGPDQVTTLDDTTPGDYLLCMQLSAQDVPTCTDLTITSP